MANRPTLMSLNAQQRHTAMEIAKRVAEQQSSVSHHTLVAAPTTPAETTLQAKWQAGWEAGAAWQRERMVERLTAWIHKRRGETGDECYHPDPESLECRDTALMALRLDPSMAVHTRGVSLSRAHLMTKHQAGAFMGLNGVDPCDQCIAEAGTTHEEENDDDE